MAIQISTDSVTYPISNTIISPIYPEYEQMNLPYINQHAIYDLVNKKIPKATFYVLKEKFVNQYEEAYIKLKPYIKDNGYVAEFVELFETIIKSFDLTEDNKISFDINLTYKLEYNKKEAYDYVNKKELIPFK